MPSGVYKRTHKPTRSYKKKQAANAKAQWADPAKRKAITTALSKTMKRLWASPAYRQKMMTRRAKGKAHPRWKGNAVGRAALHAYMRKKIPQPTNKRCQRCNAQRKLGLGNKTGKYLRDIKDWHWICYSCNVTDKIPIHSRFRI